MLEITNNHFRVTCIPTRVGFRGGPRAPGLPPKGASYQTLVTNCSAERSKLKLIENRLRTSMTQERLVNLAIMSIESDILREIDFTTIITDFAAAKSRKVSGL